VTSLSESIERPGVYKRWPSLSGHLKRLVQGRRDTGARVDAVLRRYAELGQIEEPWEGLPDWCAVKSDLSVRGVMLLEAEQVRAVSAGRLGSGLGAAFAYQYVKALIELFQEESFPHRFPGRTLRKLGLDDAMWVALGFTLGCQGRTQRLGMLLIEALRRDYFFDREYYPIFYFVLRLFADWQQIGYESWPSAATREKVLNKLLERWREPKAASIATLVLAACDYHTHRCRTGMTKDYFEFDDGLFTHFPVEILMLFRLREHEGLPNPDVNHPLLSTPLGKLPKPMRCEPDEILQKVLDRAKSQGFDEEAIVWSLLGDPRVA